MPPPENDVPFTPHESLGYALKRAQQALRLHMDRRLKAFGLTAPQYNVLCSLEAEPGASNAQLARRAFVTPQTMQSMLVKLERAALIERTPDSDHGRIQRTQLSRSGRETLSKAHQAVQETERLAQAAASPDAMKMLLRVAEALS
ncbi:MarR family transcriptional regulator [Pseudooceanicola sediminis]|uniref:MarR family transcriptional regulator n=1 Tax=Pseudooceanicola sediminis TaxID=2211117 RepID=A0A399J988_9RHOB|nr:MarR family transcriptional regulator [Pseudooceanicola sediminis]KAA2316304.1 MarR family transcriptional regulator [Puniceibacterium sp. HSS470]RII39216.1 MarR family transcriptional regulator [Pseudooceanicola sediminis]|tara:strand:- start:18618 stop:19052 length:435 start_codon:yes stop_codon:yes gene_type:complete